MNLKCESGGKSPNLSELVDPFVDLGNSFCDGAVVSAHIQTQQVVMDQTQHHQAGELRRRGRDVAGALARSVVQVVHVVQAGAVVRVRLGL